MLQSRVLLGHERRELTIGAALGCPRSSGEWTVKEDRFKDSIPGQNLECPESAFFRPGHKNHVSVLLRHSSPSSCGRSLGRWQLASKMCLAFA